jgi:hypothetical protein
MEAAFTWMRMSSGPTCGTGTCLHPAPAAARDLTTAPIIPWLTGNLRSARAAGPAPSSEKGLWKGGRMMARGTGRSNRAVLA